MEERDLPEEWEWKKLGDFCYTSTGGTPNRSIDKYFNGNIPWLKSGELRNYNIKCAEESISEYGLNNSSARIIPKGSLLIALYGATAGKVGILDFDCAINQAICAIVPSKEADPKFLFYYLMFSRNRILGMRIGGAQPNISQETVKNFQIPLPSLPVQRRIVEILEQADALRRLRAQADAETQKLLQSVFYEMFGDPVRNEKGWEVVEFGEIITHTRNGLYKPDGFYGVGIPIVRMYNIFNNRIEMANHHLITISEEDYQQYRLDPGDIIINRVNSLIWLGKSAVIPNDIGRAVFESKNIRIKIRNEIANPHYIVHYLSTPRGRNEILKKSKNAVNQSTINNDDLRRFEILLPPLTLQEQFAQIVEEVDLIRLKQTELKNGIGNLFDGLMAKAFAGELN
jgi:type I restriction enzyme, S subunit